MTALRSLGLAVVALGLLGVLPRPALGQSSAEEYPPGITVSGAALARVAAPAKPSDLTIRRAIDAAQPTVVARALSDARRRAKVIADAAGVELGEVEAIELGDGFPARARHCTTSRRNGRERCRVPAFTAASATVTFAIPGGAEPSEGTREVVGSGRASAPVRPAGRRNSPMIRRALSAARSTVTPEAARAALRKAEAAARAADLTLGPIVSITEERELYYFGFGPAFGGFDPGLGAFEPTLGGFEPGRFCRTVRRPVLRRDRASGGRGSRGVRLRRVRRCFFPRTLSVRFEARLSAR
jgi:uncharacterized protein YggE